MTESLIAVGDTIWNCEGEAIEITNVKQGEHGVLWNGTGLSGGSTDLAGYVIPELPLSEAIMPWYGWARKSTITLKGNFKVSNVSFARHEHRPLTVEEHEAEFERTIAAMKPEMGVKPLSEVMK